MFMRPPGEARAGHAESPQVVAVSRRSSNLLSQRSVEREGFYRIPGVAHTGVSWASCPAAADDGLAERFDVTPRVTPRITPTDPRELKLEESSV